MRRPLPGEAWDTYPELAKMAAAGKTAADIEAGKALAELERWRHQNWGDEVALDIETDDDG